MEESTSPLPNQDDDDSDSGLSHYVVRVTPCGKFSYEDLLDTLLEEPEICRYVVGKELVPQEHYHLVLSVDESIDIQGVRDIIRAFIVPYWSEGGKLPRGFGNKQYNLQVADDIYKAISYAVKLNDYRHEGWSDEFIASRVAESFEKKKPSNFKAEYLSLCETFQESNMDISDFMVNFIKLKAKYGQQVNGHTAYGFALSNMVLRDPSYAESFVDNFLSKQ